MSRLLDIWPSFSNFANRDTSWLVTTHHCPARRKCVRHSSPTLLPHPMFLFAVFKPHTSLRSPHAAHPSWRLYRTLPKSRQLDLALLGLQQVPRATRQILPTSFAERRADARGTSAVPCTLLLRYGADHFAHARGACVAPVNDEAQN